MNRQRDRHGKFRREGALLGGFVRQGNGSVPAEAWTHAQPDLRFDVERFYVVRSSQRGLCPRRALGAA